MASERSNYKDFEWSIKLNRFGLYLSGLWPENHEKDKNIFVSKIYVSIVFILINFVCTVPLICSLVQVWGDMILMIDNLQLTLSIIVASLKLVIIRWKRSTLSLIVNMMVEDWMYLRVDAERNVMMKRAQVARLIAICGYLITTFGLLTTIVLPLFGLQYRFLTNITDSGKVLPLQAYYFYDTDKSPQFEFTLVAQAVSMFLILVIYTSVDAFFGLTIFYMCGQLENFRYRLLHLTSYNDFDNALRYNIETHLRLIRFADNIEDVFTLLVLILLFYFSIVFCTFCFLMVTLITSDELNDTSFSRMGFTALAITHLFGHTFLYCGGGELVANECKAVYRVMCDLEWYKLEPRKSRALILIMIRTSEPFRITAGKIVPLSLATFSSLLKTSVGYISFLLAKRD
ncbi:odorant receptor 22c-like [Linepithema humile]|uniref:odorant receptor 22c-like n=1 Tax=Linepithema humile TaxID=83485 RepID=UPI00351EA454